MSANELIKKYTIDNYCSRNEVARALGTNLIDPIWATITSHRNQYARPLGIKDTNGQSFMLTHIDPVDRKEIDIVTQVSKYKNLFESLSEGSFSRKTLINDMNKLALRNVARLNKIDASEITISKIINNEMVGEEYSLLVNYLRALNVLRNESYVEISEDFFANYYSILRGEEELSSFYRLSNNASNASRSLVDRQYDNGVPAHFIESFMTSLISYLNDDFASLTSKISLIFFIFNYVKPFDEFNNELAIITAKAVLGNYELGSLSTYVSLESWMSNVKFGVEVTKDVIKTHDFTYAYLLGANLLNEAFIVVEDKITQLNGKELDNAIRYGDDAKAFEEEFGVKPREGAIEEVKVTPQPKVVVAPKVTPKPITKVVKQVEVPSEDLPSEKELKAKEQDLVESNPFINKKQAHFYVHHCTKGKFYTIQQYKKFIGCVYETARTSMDNLAMQGFYRREQVKNKFVYTPIDME